MASRAADDGGDEDGPADAPRPPRRVRGRARESEGREVPPTPGFEVLLDDEFQRRSWAVERVAWAGMLLVVLAALLGLFGSGPLSRTFAVDPGSPVWIEYDRFGRLQGPADLRVYLGPNTSRAGKLRVWLDAGFLDAVRLERVTPEPAGHRLGAGRVGFEFLVSDPDRPAAVTFRYQPERAGPLSGRVGLDEGAPVRFGQFVYP